MGDAILGRKQVSGPSNKVKKNKIKKQEFKAILFDGIFYVIFEFLELKNFISISFIKFG